MDQQFYKEIDTEYREIRSETENIISGEMICAMLLGPGKIPNCTVERLKELQNRARILVEKVQNHEGKITDKNEVNTFTAAHQNINVLYVSIKNAAMTYRLINRLI